MTSPRSTDKVVIVGQGYVGLPLAMAAVDAGFSVVGYDTDEDRTKRLAGGGPTWKTSASRR